MSAVREGGAVARVSVVDGQALAPGLSFGLDLLRHVFCVAVIVQHMASASRYSPTTQQALAGVVTWVDGAVLGFFFVSGFLFRTPGDLGTYARQQAARLLLPYAVFSFLYAALLALVGKVELADGLVATVSLRGAGMQLYFLPYLLLVTVLYAACTRVSGAQVVLWAGTFALALFWPTTSPSGPTPLLLPLYLLAFSLGVVVRRWARLGHGTTASGALALAACGVGTLDARFNDLAMVAALFFLVFALRARLPSRRLPGSGGIYLLHTPVANFAISAALAHLGVQQGWNVAATVLLTYGLCLLLTLWLIRRWPAWRALLLE